MYAIASLIYWPIWIPFYLYGNSWVGMGLGVVGTFVLWWLIYLTQKNKY